MNFMNHHENTKIKIAKIYIYLERMGCGQNYTWFVENGYGVVRWRRYS